MIISARPYPDIRLLSSRGDFLGADGESFYPLGRDALLSGLSLRQNSCEIGSTIFHAVVDLESDAH